MKKILIADKNMEIAGFIESMAKNEGLSITTTSDGFGCLKKSRTNPPDLLLLDMMLSDMSCWEICRQIKKNNKQTKIAIMGNVDISLEMKKSLLKRGFSDYIMKPFTVKELTERICSLLSDDTIKK